MRSCRGFVALKMSLVALAAGFLIVCVQGMKIPFGNVGYELGDYRLSNGDPFVNLYEHENYRGKIVKQKVSKDCLNIPEEYDNWTSSILLNGRCVTLCDGRGCTGDCKNVYPDMKGVKRLTSLGLNDRASSLKFCYQYG